MVGVAGLPTTCVYTDPVGSQVLRGVYARAELVDPLLPGGRFKAVDARGVRSQRDDRDACGGGARGRPLHGPLVERLDSGRIVILIDDLGGIQSGGFEQAQRFVKVVAGS